MITTLRRLVATGLLAGTLALVPAVAGAAPIAPTSAQRDDNYIGYGCGGWYTVRWFPPLAANDCWAGQSNGCALLMRTDYSGVAAPGTRYWWGYIC